MGSLRRIITGEIFENTVIEEKKGIIYQGLPRNRDLDIKMYLYNYSVCKV